MKMTRDESITLIKKYNPHVEIDKIVFTCDDCEIKDACVWVYDPYNTDGDCIALK